MTREQILNLIKERPVEVGHWCGFDKLDDLQNDWLRNFLFRSDDQTLLAHRNSYKTTTLSLFFSLFLLLRPEDNIIYLRKTDADVAEIARQSARMLHSGAFQKMSEVIWQVPLIVTRETGTEIDTSLNHSPRGASQLLGLGLGSSITGKHSNLICTDDIVNTLDRVSAAEREKTKLAYAELQNIRNKGGRLINCGTPWHKDDAISLMPNKRIFDCYSTGIFTKEEIQQKRDSMSASLFAANYELRHIADGNALFSDAHFADAEDTEKIFDGIGHIDAAYGGGDSVAFTIMKQQPDGSFLAYGKLWPEAHVQNCMTDIYNLWSEYRCGTIYCEDNGDKGYLARDLEDLGIPSDTYHEKQNKFLKISTKLKGAWKNIRWIPATDPEYLLQITDYTEQAAHDDAPDSAASLIRIYEDKPELLTHSYWAGGL